VPITQGICAQIGKVVVIYEAAVKVQWLEGEYDE